MIDLRGLKVRVETREECEKLFEVARKQGFKWMNGEELYITRAQPFPDAIHFHEKREVTWCCDYYNIEAKDIFRIENETENKEMTAREFLEGFIKLKNCGSRDCNECVFSSINLRSKFSLCNNENWNNSNIDKLIELVEKDDPIYHSTMTESEAAYIIDDLSAALEEYEYPISDKQKEALGLAIRKFKGGKNNEE
ncbi:hypothetical protein DW846_01960 [Ruminococcus sp. AM36-2AA]|jgi:hypothetical protein|nr:hypothetical protein DW851_01955 [Ruminococcus sp. AM36-5]RGH62389.1 hypothetical protein DW846_01960 [Ruminococcus sp. AM36-2AA]